ncbi:CpaF family protein, partial [Kineococcus glutinatus]|uniref:CpaF family protein n=1 Tax=Kineococcus glutinatus TaxID=1070872 RepID=UPI0031E57A54
AVLPPVAPEGTHLSLRVPATSRFRLDDLVRAGALPPAWVPLLRAVVHRRLSFLVSGGTGAGKTTVLEALLGEVDPAERVVLVEDAGELRPACPHVVRLEARRANVEGRGEVPLEVLVRQALRMRPDRVVVGECRGAEVRDLLAALNTGHAGGAGTVHANTAADVVARVQALGALAGMGPAAVDAQLVAAVDLVLHVERGGAGPGRGGV